MCKHNARLCPLIRRPAAAVLPALQKCANAYKNDENRCTVYGVEPPPTPPQGEGKSRWSMVFCREDVPGEGNEKKHKNMSEMAEGSGFCYG